MSGHFDSCTFCRLSAADHLILKVFLRSRGNLRDVQAHLGVSYPTARARMTEVLDRLDLGEEPPAIAAPAESPPPPQPAGAGEPDDRAPNDLSAVLLDLAAGRIDVDEAEALLDSP